MGRACSTNWEKMNACRVLVGKPEGWYGRIDLAGGRPQWRALVNTVMSLRVP
jgi:hypothetical protein